MTMRINLLLTTLLALVLGVAGCNRNENDNVGPNSESAILYNINTNSPDGYIGYMGVYPEVPTSDPDRSKMVEIGRSTRAYAHNGAVYTVGWDAKTMTKWEVTSDLKLNRVGTMSFANAGLSNWIPVSFFNETRAFMFDLVNGKVLEWNPKDMTITRTLTVPVAPNAFSYADNPRVFNNRILMNVHNIDFDNGSRMDPKATVALFDVNAQSLTYKTDSRMPTTYLNVMDSRGRVYLVPSRDEHYSLLFGQNRTITNWGRMIRFDMNTGEFDPTFMLDVKALAGGPISHMYYLNDNELLVSTTVEPLPANLTADNYFALAKARLRKLNINSGQVTDVSGIGQNVQAWINNVDFNIDGAFYYPAADMPNGDYDKVTTRLYRVTSSGATLQFSSTNSWPIMMAKVR